MARDPIAQALKRHRRNKRLKKEGIRLGPPTTKKKRATKRKPKKRAAPRRALQLPATLKAQPGPRKRRYMPKGLARYAAMRANKAAARYRRTKKPATGWSPDPIGEHTALVWWLGREPKVGERTYFGVAYARRMRQHIRAEKAKRKR